MKPKDSKYILENIDKKSVEEQARHLGLRARKVKKFIDEHKKDTKPAALPERVKSSPGPI